ncbi:hypothetical protein GCM10023321_81050 [Pseudonocardia eucalypti]|uniref:Uncharacterized protein n=1 Tax=Pseudonocardia eucalypti TaxID=648755 RepID=A0ABP9RDK6_9PSEU
MNTHAVPHAVGMFACNDTSIVAVCPASNARCSQRASWIRCPRSPGRAFRNVDTTARTNMPIVDAKPQTRPHTGPAVIANTPATPPRNSTTVPNPAGAGIPVAGGPPGWPGGVFRLSHHNVRTVAPHTCAATATPATSPGPATPPTTPAMTPNPAPTPVIHRSRPAAGNRIPVNTDGFAAITNATSTPAVPTNQSRCPSHNRSNP